MNLILANELNSSTSTTADVTSTSNQPLWSWDEFFQKIINWLQTSGLKLLIGFIILLILFSIINGISKSIRKSMIKHHRDLTLTNVTYKCIKFFGKLVAVLLFLGFVGFDTAGIGTLIASLSVGIGLAIQGSLSNLAGWFIIIFMRPFRLDDFIEAQGVLGTVEEIKVFYTYLKTPDNKVVMIPNGALANGNITNYSIKDIRRVDNVFQISYGDDTVKAIEVIQNVLNSNALILKDPESFVKVSACAASGIDITVRCWVKNADYWTVYFTVIADVKKAFDENNITVPYNQLDVHVI